jgi:hypothetical protein
VIGYRPYDEACFKALTPGHGMVIVTGSNGRLGDAVMQRLAERFGGVIGFDRKAPQSSSPCMSTAPSPSG